MAGSWAVLDDFDQIMNDAGYTVLPLTQQHALLAAQFGSEHRDPFDRMIAASAINEACLLLSIDKALDTFGVHRIW